MKSSQYGSGLGMVLVTTVNFHDVIEVGDPISQAKIYEAQAADELIFLDLDARQENRETMVSIVREAADEIFMPFTVGGGVDTVADFRHLLSNGADKVSINTAAVNTPELITQASDTYGAQCVVVSIDYKQDDDGRYFVWINGGKEKTTLNPVEWAMEAEKRGAGEFLISSIDRDGTSTGLDCEMTRLIAETTSVPLITAGGCGLASHFVEGFAKGKADAVSAGTYFCLKDQNPMQARSHIKNSGIPIRFHM